LPELICFRHEHPPVCPDILVCTPLAEAVCAKLLTRSRPELPPKKKPQQGGAAREAKVLISLKVSNLDQTATIEGEQVPRC
jgi:hypothetical protein